jgi:NAD(P)-dependent dehydrogenase (short-subunit alcohol dehydrogenase family)
MASWTVADIPDQTGKTAVVTGANSGIGFHTARELARRGAHVILACRNEARGDNAVNRIRSEIPPAQAELALLDLSDLDSVQKFADGFVESARALDLLVNNAGVMAIPRRQTTAQGFEMQFGTNHLGHFALTGRLLPGLLARPGARVVTVSSYNHRLARNVGFDDLQSERAYTPWTAYNRSKLANVLFFLELDRRLRRSGQRAVSIGAHPGYSATNLQFSGPREGGTTVSARLLGVLTRLVAQSDSQGALPSLYAATAPDVTGGGYYGPSRFRETRGHPKPAQIAKQGRDEEAARRLWETSAELTHVRYELLAAD